MILGSVVTVIILIVCYFWFKQMEWINWRSTPVPNTPVNFNVFDGKSKDPTDMSLTELSTKWNVVDCCPSCHTQLSHDEFMDEQCHTCGFMGRMTHNGKMARDIMFQGHWRKQIVFRNTKETLIDGELFGKVIPPQKRL